ncbi:Pleiotropic drug resistance protein 1 [Linum grandiflorum]
MAGDSGKTTANNSSIWSSDTSAVGAMSIMDDDDKKALRRGKRKVGAIGRSGELSLHNLALKERRALVDSLVKVPEIDNEKFLHKFRSRIDKVGVELPTIEVRFQNLSVEAEARSAGRALPTMYNFAVNFLEGLLSSLHIISNRKRKLTILKGVSGVIKPSRMTLLLGPPSSGKTTFLLALAGQLDPDLKCTGCVSYNGYKMKEFVPQRTAAYISQNDNHIAEMTVRETLAFSARCQGVGFLSEMLAELLKREKASHIKPDAAVDLYMKAAALDGQQASVVTDYVLKILGLEECADTNVGSIMLRGISGGQKKRLTIGEMLVGPARVLYMDEISNGLDASTTFQIVNSMRQSTHILKGTTVISLLQPPPETYELFDDIILLSDGHVVYHGPRDDILDFFQHMGFRCPDRKCVADFLQEVTSKNDQRQYWARKDQSYSYVSVREFAESFKEFTVGEGMRKDLSRPFDKNKGHAAALAFRKYGISEWELFRACLSREFLLMKKNSFVFIFKVVQLTIMALILMTLFPKSLMHRETVIDGVIYMGALFFIVSMIIFNGMADLSMTIAKLPVFYKQRNFGFYPPWAFSLPPSFLLIPTTLVEVAVWVSITYFMIGFDPELPRFLKQYFLLILVGQMSSALFRFLAALGRNQIVASTLSSFILLVLMTLSGFVLSRDSINKFWIWIFWISPFMYADNAILVNEFLGDNWNQVSSGSNETLGMQVLNFRGFFTDPNWYWIGIGALFGFTILFNLGFAVALTYLNPFDKPQALISKETTSDDEAYEASMRAGALSFQKSFNQTHDESDDDSSSSDSYPGMEMTSGTNSGKKKGMVLPFEPYSITFDEITYAVDAPQHMKEKGMVKDKLYLLKGVSGAFRPGVLTALMGVTGAGKTTLMDVLAGRKTHGYTQGTITISGFPKNQDTFARIAGYCEQNDIHSPFVTVHESLLYSAWLRLSTEVNTQTRKMFVEEVMALVELDNLRHSIVGLPGVNGLSTEQRKRLTIAVELVANPSIIFMDEPTSGLDARAAAIVMRTVRNTVDTGRTVVCTIHQPSIDIFESFDELFLLKRGGQELYVGPLGKRSCHLIKYFEGIEGVCKIKDGYNPATWMMEVSTPGQEATLGVDFAGLYRKSDLYKRNKALIQELSKPLAGSKDLYFSTKFSRSIFTQCLACLWKFHLSYWRNQPYTGVRFLFTTIIALLFGGMFWDLGSRFDNEQDLFNAIGSMFTAVFSIGIQNASTVQPVVDIERTVFYRERAAGMYAAFPYAVGHVLIELPYILLQSVLYSSIVYIMIGFELTVIKCFWFVFFMYFTLLYFTFYGMMAVSFTPNQHIGYIVSTAFYGLWNIFAGFIIPRPRAPIWWRWYYYACPVSWTLYGFVASQYGDLKNILMSGLTVESFIELYFGFQHDMVPFVGAVVVGFGVLFILIFATCIMMLNFQRK